MIASTVESVRVLVVDEHSAACALARSYLQSADYAVEFVSNVETLSVAFARASAQLVLLELTTSEEDMLALLRQLRALPGGEATAIVSVFAEADPVAERRALSWGADDAWVWGLARSELLWRVRSLLRLKRQVPAAPASELLRIQRDELLTLHQRREDTLALLVHDMKNPLSGVISNAEFLVSGGGLDAEQQASAQDIVQASRRLHRMVLSMLDESLSEQGLLQPVHLPLDASVLLADVRAICSGRLRDKSVELRMLVAPRLPSLRGDRDMLLRLLANLLDNAIGASSVGGAIELAVSAHSDGLEFRVSDAGPTLSEPERRRLLEELSPRTPEHELELELRPRMRRGLGLRACRVLTEAHSGRIWVDERQPRGTSVYVKLPITAPKH
jgi:signal transduction histidine kinase